MTRECLCVTHKRKLLDGVLLIDNSMGWMAECKHDLADKTLLPYDSTHANSVSFIFIGQYWTCQSLMPAHYGSGQHKARQYKEQRRFNGSHMHKYCEMNPARVDSYKTNMSCHLRSNTLWRHESPDGRRIVMKSDHGIVGICFQRIFDQTHQCLRNALPIDN